MKDPGVRERMLEQGLEGVGSPAEVLVKVTEVTGIFVHGKSPILFP